MIDAYFDEEERVLIAVMSSEKTRVEHAKWAMFTHGVCTNLTSQGFLGFHAIAITERHISLPLRLEDLTGLLDRAIRKLPRDIPRALKLATHLEAERDNVLAKWLLSIPQE